MKHMLTVLALSLALPAVAIAQTADPTVTQERSPQDKQKTDGPGNTGGTTSNPNAKPTDSSITEKQKKDQMQAPGASEGASTGEGAKAADPEADPMDSSLTEKQKEEQGTP